MGSPFKTAGWADDSCCKNCGGISLGTTRDDRYSKKRRSVLHAKLQNFIHHGCLSVTWPNGHTTTFRGPKEPVAAPNVAVRLSGKLTPIKIAFHPDRFLGEAYMDGTLRIERGTLWDLLELLGQNLEDGRGKPRSSLYRLGRRMMNQVAQYNSRSLARRNVTHHYDLSNQLYRLFLDEDLQYSCAYFPTPNLSLDEAQRAKKRHLAAKLLLAPGQKILDIGCGWGGLALSLAQTEKVQVLGVTLSREQLDVARERAQRLRLSDRVSFELLDYRDVKGTFDRIVSVGMFEHVGIPNYPRFFDAICSLLGRDGIAVLHSIGRMHGPSATSAWIQKYIFPGGHIPALSEVLPQIETSGLWVTDLEVLRLHYANTLRLWRERFLQNREAVASIYDERFCRMWEFYLAGSEMSFRYDGFMVFQLQLAREIASVPLTRSYLFPG
jgi:cyclopropane-fatty-acyl-phospholipid synthase